MNGYCTVLICISHWLSIGHLDIRTDLAYTFSYFVITHVYDMLITYAISSMGKDSHTQIDNNKIINACNSYETWSYRLYKIYNIDWFSLFNLCSNALERFKMLFSCKGGSCWGRRLKSFYVKFHVCERIIVY